MRNKGGGGGEVVGANPKHLTSVKWDFLRIQNNTLLAFFRCVVCHLNPPTNLPKTKYGYANETKKKSI